jgi:hypothetical protein
VGDILDDFVSGLWKREGRDYVIVCLYAYWTSGPLFWIVKYLADNNLALEGTYIEHLNRMMLFRVRTVPCTQGKRMRVTNGGKARTLKEVVRYEKLEREAQNGKEREI